MPAAISLSALREDVCEVLIGFVALPQFCDQFPPQYDGRCRISGERQIFTALDRRFEIGNAIYPRRPPICLGHRVVSFFPGHRGAGDETSFFERDHVAEPVPDSGPDANEGHTRAAPPIVLELF